MNYVTYILSFDEKMVASAIGERFGGEDNQGGESFLEKIIQVSLKMPKALQSDLNSYMFKLIESVIEDLNIILSEDEQKRFSDIFISHISNRLKNPRLATRYANLLKFYLPLMQGEINTVDLMIIEAVKVFYPEFYSFIKGNSEFMLESYNMSNMLTDEKSEKLQAKIEEISEQYEEEDKHSIRSLLQAIFPQINFVYHNHHYFEEGYQDKWYSEKRICADQYFDRYFTYSIQKGSLSDALFNSVMSNVGEFNYEELGEKFESMVEKSNGRELITNIRSRRNSYDLKTSVKISKALGIKRHLFLGDDTGFSMFTPASSEVTLLIKDFIERLESEEERLELADFIMKNGQPFSFAYDLNNWLRDTREEHEFFSLKGYQKLAETLREKALKEAGGLPVFETHERYATYIL
ncbi:MAG: putative KAP-like P-loop ATPase, partial [Saprospiraceae bacterium]